MEDLSFVRRRELSESGGNLFGIALVAISVLRLLGFWDTTDDTIVPPTVIIWWVRFVGTLVGRTEGDRLLSTFPVVLVFLVESASFVSLTSGVPGGLELVEDLFFLRLRGSGLLEGLIDLLLGLLNGIWVIG